MANEQQADVNVNVNGEQAEEQLRDLIKVTQKWKKELVEAYRAGDDKKIKEARKNLNAAEKGARELQKQLFDVDKVLRNLGGSSLKDLYTAQRNLNKELKSGAIKRNSKEWNELTGKLRKVNGEIKKVGAEMRGASKSSGLWTKGLMNLKMILPALGIGAFVTSFVAGIRSAIKISTEFEKSLSSLSAITGVVGEDLEFYKKKAIEYSSVTLKSANEIVQAFELVGSIRPELLKDSEALAEVTKQAIILSEATGGKLGLEEAAKATAGTLNQFSKDATEAADVINVLAAGSKFGAAAVVSITESINKFGAVADQANMSLEQSVGLVETLAEKQIVGAEAGTKLRNILILLQSDQANYTDGVFDLNLALENLGSANMNVTELTELFGKENVVAAQILVNSRDKVINYTEAVTGTNTALEQQSIQNDNVAGALTRLSNSWDTFMLKINASNGVLADNLRFLNAILKVLNEGDDDDGKSKKLFDASGVVDDTALVKKSLEELKTELVSLKSDSDVYFTNWKKKTGEEKAFWAGQYDIAKQNIEIIDQAILSRENEIKTTKEVVKNVEDLGEKLREVEEVYGSIGNMATRGLKDVILSEEDKEILLENIEQINQATAELMEPFAIDEEEEGRAALLAYFFGDDWQEGGLDEKIAAIGDLAMGLLTDINQIITNGENQQLMHFKKNVSDKKKLLNKQLNDGVITYEEYTARISNLDEDLDKKKRKIAHDQAVRAKALGIMQATINTAVAVVGMLKDPGGIAGIVLAALAGVLGAVQIGIVASEPVPQYAQGRYPVTGATDGKTYNANYVGDASTGIVRGPSLVSERGDEMIIDGPTTSKLAYDYPGVIEDIVALSKGLTPQFAAGRMPVNTKETSTQTFTDPAMLEMMGAITEYMKNPPPSKLVTDEDYLRTHNEENEKYQGFQTKVN